MKTVVAVLIIVAIGLAGFVAFSLIYPQTAVAPGGGTGSGIADLITVDSPTKNQKITSPVTVSGKARGGWYFEASFPIEILDQNGNVIGQGQGQAKSDWMTSEFVPFSSSITFTSPGAGKTGTLRVKNDNPSGDPARDKHFDIPVTF